VIRPLIAHGEVVVVETEDDVFVGTAEFVGDSVVVRSGFRGHPVVIPVGELVSINPASGHEDIVSQ
jgi:hypothetical protein